MMARLILGSILGAVVLFIWMGISWMVLPWHCATLKPFSHEESVSSVIMANTERSGIYVLPSCKDWKSKESAEAMKKGPIVFASIQRNGSDVESPRPYITAFIIYLIGAFFATFLLLQTLNLTYGGRVWFITAFGIAAGVLAAFPDWNWWGFSFSYTVVAFLDFVIGWFLAGLVIAAITKKKTVTTT